MAIVPSDIVYRLSVAAAAGDTTAGSPATSLGDQVSTSAITTEQMNNLWDNVSGAEAAAGDVEYRCIFVLNNHATLTLEAAKVEVTSQPPGGALALALDNIAISAKGSASAQAAAVANESTSPGAGAGAFGVGPLTIGDLGPGQVKGIWLRRTTNAGAEAGSVSGIINVFGDTPA